MNSSLDDTDLHAYVDGALDAARQAEVERYLAAHPDAAAKVAAYRAQNAALHARYDALLTAPIPQKLLTRRRIGRPALAAAMTFLTLGAGVLGWTLRGVVPVPVPLAQQAASAYVVYAVEKRHPVEIGADAEEHLVQWLSRRLGHSLTAPRLQSDGYTLMGGRLLPAEGEAAALLMYANRDGERLALYVRKFDDNTDTGFRYARENGVGVFYWVDRSLGYALVGRASRDELLTLAHRVHAQLPTAD